MPDIIDKQKLELEALRSVYDKSIDALKESVLLNRALASQISALRKERDELSRICGLASMERENLRAEAEMGKQMLGNMMGEYAGVRDQLTRYRAVMEQAVEALEATTTVMRDAPMEVLVQLGDITTTLREVLKEGK